MYYLLLLAALCVMTARGEASYLYKDGKWMHADEAASFSVQEHYSLAMEACEKKEWSSVLRHMRIILKNFPKTTLASEARFYLGMACFHEGEYEEANAYFSEYLKTQQGPQRFEEVMEYKCLIADQFRGGAKKHIMGMGKLPKWQPAHEDALTLYDEVITALPHRDLAAEALFHKAELLLNLEEYELSLESYQVLMRRFPKHPRAIDSYLGVAKLYLKQCKAQYPDPNFLDLARINLHKFSYDFPGEERTAEAESIFVEMQEVYAQSLYETAQFFERTKKPGASLLYYKKIVEAYPETKVAVLSKQRISRLDAR